MPGTLNNLMQEKSGSDNPVLSQFELINISSPLAQTSISVLIAFMSVLQSGTLLP